MFESKEKVKAIGGSIFEINKEKKKEKQNGVDNRKSERKITQKQCVLKGKARGMVTWE